MTPPALMDTSSNLSSGNPGLREPCQAAGHNLDCCRAQEGILFLPLLQTLLYCPGSISS